MDIPNDLNACDFTTVYEIVTSRDFERDTFDFKEVLNPRGSSQNPGTQHMNISRTVSSMANGNGGYIIFGVKDPKKHPTLTPEQRIVGIPKSSENLKDFGDKILNIQPGVYCIPRQTHIAIPTDNTRGIFVVHVPTSLRRPHMVEPEGKFYIRGTGGSAEPMPFYLVREQMMYTEERLRKVTLFRLKLARNRKLAGEMWTANDPPTKIYYRFDTGLFDVLLADICGLLPPSTGLLEQLLEISIIANSINEFLEHTTLSYLPNDVTNKYINLINKCQECEKQLQQIFGTLPGEHQ